VNLTITASGTAFQVNSSAKTVGEALAEAGIPLLGSDHSLPSAHEPLPSDGMIHVVRVNETVLLAQNPIPFTSEFIASAEVPLDQTQLLQPGEPGLTMQRIRVRYENGVEVSRSAEDETTVRPPTNRVLGYGTKIEIKTAVVDGVTIEYWRAVQMYVTSYSPCRSGGDRCYSGTSSGAKVQRGVAGMRYEWYLVMGGQQLYIPGYGFATVEDVCGGCVGKPWIDVAYSDDDYVPWSSWVTVYFLTPVPSSIIYTLE
jgi:3D (Asp-Asp-Asp) domain-containing protein